MAVVLLLSLGVTLTLTNVLTRPVTELVSVARAVSRGELSARTSVSSHDEIGELAHAFNVMIDGLSRSRAELLQRVHELETLNATAEALSGKLELGELLKVAIERVLELTDSPAGWIFLDEGPGAQLAAQVGLPAGFSADERPIGCPCEPVMREAQTRVAHTLQNPCCCGVGTASGDLACLACVPLVAGQRVVGVLNVVCAAPRILGQEEVRLLDSVGRQVGLAVENARLWEEVKGREARLAQLVTQLISTQEAERKRIARELHDEAGQRLAAVSLGLQTIEQTDGLPDAVKHLVADSMELLKRLLDEVHQLAVDLRPHALDQLGLRGAIESCVREFGQRTALRTDLEVSGFDDARPSSDIEIAIYRVVQEALANVRKHANASRVGVLLKRLNGSVVVVVEDDGIGFDAAGALRLAEDGQLGLFGMRERAALLNGQLTIESGRGQGTTVIVEIPISDVRDSDSPG
jgi:signal transduction histidine kinase